MIPLSQTLLLASYPPAKAGMALAMWAITTLVAPVVGPLLGGVLTDNLGWEWIFFVNVPVGIIGLILAAVLVVGLVISGLSRAGVAGFCGAEPRISVAAEPDIVEHVRVLAEHADGCHAFDVETVSSADMSTRTVSREALPAGALSTCSAWRSAAASSSATG